LINVIRQIQAKSKNRNRLGASGHNFLYQGHQHGARGHQVARTDHVGGPRAWSKNCSNNVSAFIQMNIINFSNIIKDILNIFFISEVCIELVALRINRYPRSNPQFQKGWWHLLYPVSKFTPQIDQLVEGKQKQKSH